MADKDYGVRESLRLRDQVDEQVQIVRFALVDGNEDVLSRAIEGLKIMLWNWLPKGSQEDYEKIRYEPMKMSDFFNDDDRKEMNYFNTLGYEREKELNAKVNNENRVRFLAVAGEKATLLFSVIKNLGLGFDIETDAVISKKKVDPNGEKIITIIKYNINEDERNFLIIVIGDVGTGKSFCALALAEMMDGNFDIDRVCFSKTEFIRQVRAGLPIGSWLVGDEISSWFNSREFQTKGNIALSKLIQTFRHKRFGVIFTLPRLKQTDKNLRIMGDALIETIKVNRKESVVETKYKMVQTNAMTGKTYEKFPVVVDDGERKTITRLMVGRPSEALEKEYIKKKEAYTADLNAKIEKQFEKDDGKMEEEEMEPNYECTECNHSWFSKSKMPRCPKDECRSRKVGRVDGN